MAGVRDEGRLRRVRAALTLPVDEHLHLRRHPSRDERALQTISLAMLFLGGATAVLVSLIFPSAPQVDRTTGAILGSLGYPAALLVYLGGRRWPVWMFEIVLAAGTLLTGAGIYAAHGAGVGASAAFFYVWVALYAFYFFSLLGAVGQLVLAAATYGIVQALDGGPGAAGEWVLAMGTAAVAGVVIRLLSAQLRRAAITDPLTGLANRQVLSRTLTVEIARAGRAGSALSVSVLDLDGFKAVNDELGHEAGDAVLREQAQQWSSQPRATDTIVRYGGDEFVVIMPGLSLPEASGVITRLTNSGAIKASAGIAEYGGNEGPDDLLRRADEALYASKRKKDSEPSG